MKYAIRIFLLFIILVMIAALIYCFGFGDCFSARAWQSYSDAFNELVAVNYLEAVLIYTVTYGILIAASFPIVMPLTILGGYAFGTWLGIFYSLLAATSGSIIVFALFRYVFGAAVQRRYNKQLTWFNAKVQRYGSSYLLVLHFLLVPYSIINVLAAITPISWWTFIWTTIVGSFPILVIYAFAGTQLKNIQSTSDILSPSIIILFVVLVLFSLLPIIIKWRRKV
jgi:uncharacterized membrane protein YdjX (TVP38/TMEM64 family)